MQDRRGAIIGDILAKKMGWKVGDKVTLQSGIYRGGDWEFTVDGIYTATRKSLDRSQFIFHWDYLNENAPVRMKDQVGWVVARVTDRRQPLTRELEWRHRRHGRSRSRVRIARREPTTVVNVNYA